MSGAILEVNNLKTYFSTDRGVVKAVNGMNFSLGRGEVLGIVGESGSGKSMTAFSIMNLLPPAGRIVEGEVIYKDVDLCKLKQSKMKGIRGKEISMIFQNPVASLNPVLTIGKQLTEVIKIHKHYSQKEAVERAIKMLDRVGIPEAEHRLKQYPHEFSGGMCQRIMIAIALSCNPKILIADEPTTSLDVTTQAQIISLIKDLRESSGMSVIWITHDLATLSGLADYVLVVYGGQMMEFGKVDYIYENPRHPYTSGLLGCIPNLRGEIEALESIEGEPPDLSHPPPGCPFSPRCNFANERCRKEEISLLNTDIEGNLTTCWRWELLK